MDPRKLINKRVLIVGYGVTGASVARYLQRQSIAFDLADECSEAVAQERAAQLDCTVFNQFDADVFLQYDVLVLSPGVPRKHPAIQAALDNQRCVIGDVELFASVVDAPVIAVTGSNGKSTVVSWVEHALRSAGINAIACGNIGEPALDSLLSNADVYVLELSSYQLESTESLKPLIATVLNLSEDHLDRYDDMEHYARTKRQLLHMAECCVINQDDQLTWPRAESTACARSERFSLCSEVDGNIRWHRMEKDGEYWLCDDGFALLPQSELNLPGDHNAANALAVLALIEALAVPFTAIREGLVSFRGLPHRSEYLGEQGGVRWYNDSKGTNVDACEKAISAMPGPVILIAGGISKGADFTALREIVGQRVRVLILMGRDREQIRQQLDGSTQIVLAEDLRSAVNLSKEYARSGDVVLLSPACSSFDMFRNFEDRGEQFSAAVREVIAA